MRTGRSVRESVVVLSTAVLGAVAVASTALAQGPPGYYDSVVESDPSSLRATLHEVIDDPMRVSGELDPKTVRRVLICSGKVYYALLAAREDTAFDDVALVRLEEIHPFPFDRIKEVLRGYGTKDFVWVQEEPWNQGAWSFVRDRMSRVLPRGAKLSYVGRPESASTASGSYRQYEEETKLFVEDAFRRQARPPAKKTRHELQLLRQLVNCHCKTLLKV